MTATKCNGCGATSTGFVCGYCGLRLEARADEADALREYQALLQSATDQERATLLTQGFLPDGEESLVNAGVSTLPFLNDDLHDDATAQAAARRLDTIIAKLSIVGGTQQAEKALLEFRSRLQSFRDHRAKQTFVGCTLLCIVAMTIGALAVWLIFF